MFVNGEEIVCTGGHPFYVVGLDKFIPARELKLYEKVLLSDGTCGTIDSIGIEALLKPEVTYNFEVADYHTYYVGECNVLVHNMCRKKNKLKPDPDAKGPHTTFKRDPATGKITNYATYEPNPLNPTGFDEVLRFDGVGHAHGGIPVPHVHTPHGVRAALPQEIPL